MPCNLQVTSKLLDDAHLLGAQPSPTIIVVMLTRGDLSPIGLLHFCKILSDLIKLDDTKRWLPPAHKSTPINAILITNVDFLKKYLTDCRSWLNSNWYFTNIR